MGYILSDILVQCRLTTSLSPMARAPPASSKLLATWLSVSQENDGLCFFFFFTVDVTWQRVMVRVSYCWGNKSLMASHSSPQQVPIHPLFTSFWVPCLGVAWTSVARCRSFACFLKQHLPLMLFATVKVTILHEWVMNGERSYFQRQSHLEMQLPWLLLCGGNSFL